MEKTKLNAAIIWAVLEGIQNGLGDGIEIVSGLWLTLICITAIRTRQFNFLSSCVGILVGVVGIFSIVPSWSVLGTVFLWLQIIWLISLGISYASRRA